LSASPTGDAARVRSRADTVPPRVAQPAPMGFVTALDDDCTHGGLLPSRGTQFVGGCAGIAWSPDGRYAVRQDKRIGKDAEGATVLLVGRRNEPWDDISALRDDMPFVVKWSPNARWFYVNHYLGSSQDRLRLFEVVNHSAVEQSGIYADAIRAMVARYPCLARHATVVASAWRWSHDGNKLLLVAYTRPDACSAEPGERIVGRPGDWEPLWMIGDVRTGRIDRASIRMRSKDTGPPPKDGPYAQF
jgi:hypothetical protein